MASLHARAVTVARHGRRGTLASRLLKSVHRVQVLGGPMHGYTLLIGKRCFVVLNTHGQKAPLDWTNDQHGYDWQQLPSGEQRFVHRTTPRSASYHA